MPPLREHVCGERHHGGKGVEAALKRSLRRRRRTALHQHGGHVVLLRRAAREGIYRLHQDFQQLGHGFVAMGRDDVLHPFLSELVARSIAILVEAVRQQYQNVSR